MKTMMFGGRALAATMVLSLSACAVGPDYVRPEVAAPAAYKENAGWKAAEPSDQVSRGGWWEIFGSAELNALQEQVAAANQNLMAAAARYRQAQALAQSAHAGLFPTLSAAASSTRSRASAGGKSPAAGNPIGNQHNLSIGASWEADVWGRVARTTEAGAASAAASAADLEAVQLSIRAELASNYFHLRALDTQLRLFDDTMRAYARSLELTQHRYASGVAARADVVQAQAQLKTAQAQAIDLRPQRAQVEHAIALLVGKTPADFSLPDAMLTTAVPLTPVGLPSQLLERRPDIAAAERHVAAANAEIGVAAAAFFPTLDLAAAAGYQSASLAHWLSSPNLFWSLGPALAQTIFDGGRRQANRDQAGAAYDESVANYRQTVLGGFQEVEDNLATLRYLEQEAEVQQDAVRFANESLAIAGNQYRAGLVSYLNVVTAQATALASERSRVDILNRRLAASVQLVRALGGGWTAAAPSVAQ